MCTNKKFKTESRIHTGKNKNKIMKTSLYQRKQVSNIADFHEHRWQDPNSYALVYLMIMEA